MKYILVNAYCKKNIGDDLFIKIFIEKYDHLNFIIIGNPNNLKFLNKYENIKIIDIYKLSYLQKFLIKFSIRNFDYYKNKKWNHFLNNYAKNISHYIILGGSMFMETINHNFETTDLINNKLKHSKKIVIGSNFGPFISNEYLSKYKEIFSSYNKVLFRDSYSANLFKDLSNVFNITDFVFNLKYKKNHIIKHSVGISVIDFEHRKSINKYSEDYYLFIKKVIQKSISDKKECFLFSFCKTENDEKAIKRLKTEFPHINTVFYDGNIEEFLKIYSSMESVVATRFHALILSLLFGQKTLSIIYSKKTRNLIKDLNNTIKYVELEDLNNFNLEELDNLQITNIDDVINQAQIYFEILDKELL